MGARMRAHDWAQTTLGPVDSWPQSLRTALNICLNSRFPILIWWGPELIMLYNDAYRPILGTAKHPQAMGRPGRDVWPEIWSIIEPMLDGVMSRGEATWSDDQLLLLERNGYLEECYFTFSYSPINNDQSQIGGVFTAVTETTTKVVSERRLRTLREVTTHTATARTAEDACALAAHTLANNRADLPFALLYLLDEAGQELRSAGVTGLPAGEMANPQRVALQVDGSHDNWADAFAQVIAHGQPQQVTDIPARVSLLPGESARDVPNTAMILPILLPTQNRPTGLLVTGISPRRPLDAEYHGFLSLIAGQVATAVADARAYEMERQRAEALAELDRAKTAFFSNISHEFRTPLTLLLGPLDDLLQQKGELLTVERSQLESIQDNALRLLKLVNTLLDFSRLQEGRMQMRYEPLDLATYTVELVSTFRSAIERAGLRLQVECPPLPESIYVDRTMWEKIVFNLLSNAFKFTFAGTISVALAWQADQVILTVTDTGTGIPAVEQSKIFSRFHQVRGAVARTYEGSGIGLALVQELVKLHGGTIGVSSVEGEGSTFTITLPTGAAHLSADLIMNQQIEPPEGGLNPTPRRAQVDVAEVLRWQPPTPPRESEAQPMDLSATSAADPNRKSVTILLADDNADMRAYLTRLLSQHYHVKAVADGVAALAAAHAHKPDLILSDVMMPKLDGFALLQAVRSEAALRAIPVILLSARAGETSRVEGLDAGADDYLIKPFSARELLARIGAHLALQRLRNETLVTLQQNEERFRIISELTSDYAYALQVQPNGELQKDWIFGAFEQITGYSQQEYESYNRWQDLLHPTDRSLAQQRAARLLAGQPDHSEFRILTKTGKTRWLRDHARPLLDEYGRVTKIVGAARDITARKEAEEALRRSEQDLRASESALRTLTETLEMRVTERTAELEHSNRELDQFAYIASHDLKTPLRGINNLAQWISEDAKEVLPEASTEHLVKLRGRVQRMERLLDDLLAYSRVGRSEGKAESIETRALVEGVVVYLLTLPEGFTIHIAETLPTLMSPRAPLELVFRNLIGNAIKHHLQPQQGTVEISAQEMGDFIEFCVRDNGPGIAAQHHERIFGMFQVLRPRDIVEGSGMGLAIVKKAVEHRKGKIRIESVEDKGTAFYFTWPKTATSPTLPD